MLSTTTWNIHLLAVLHVVAGREYCYENRILRRHTRPGGWCIRGIFVGMDKLTSGMVEQGHKRSSRWAGVDPCRIQLC